MKRAGFAAISVSMLFFLLASGGAALADGEKAVQSQEYLIGPEDVLGISVWKNEDLTMDTTVRPDGMITLPLIGDVQAGGRTPSGLREEIAARLAEFQRAVTVAVIVRAANSYKVFVLGEVMAPGTFTLKRNTSLIQAIAMAGGFTQYASRNKLVLIRESGGGSGSEKIRIRFSDIVDVDEKTDANVILKPGDTIFVP